MHNIGYDPILPNLDNAHTAIKDRLERIREIIAQPELSEFQRKYIRKELRRFEAYIDGPKTLSIDDEDLLSAIVFYVTDLSNGKENELVRELWLLDLEWAQYVKLATGNIVPFNSEVSVDESLIA